MLFLGYNLFSPKDEYVFLIKGSGPIDPVEAKKMRDEYKAYKKCTLKVKDNGKGVVLEGFTFDAAQIRQIVDTNASGIKPDSLYIAFGKDGEDSDGVLIKKYYAKMHIIAYGMIGKKLLDYSTTKTKPPSVFDKADPCPPNTNCPN